MFFSDTSRNRYHKRLSFISISVLTIGMLIGPVIAIAFPSIVYAQQLPSPPQAECKVDTVQFKHFEGLDINNSINIPGGVITYNWRKDGGGTTLTLEIATSNCSGKKIAVSVRSNRNSQNIKVLNNAVFPIEDGGGISMRMVVADEQCVFLTDKELENLMVAIADTLESEGVSFIQGVAPYRANLGYVPRDIGSFVYTFRIGWQGNKELLAKEKKLSSIPDIGVLHNPLEWREGISFLKNYYHYGWLPQEIEELDKIIKKNNIFVPSSCDYTAMARPVIDAVPGPYNPAPGAVPWVESDRLKFPCHSIHDCRAGNTWALGPVQQTVGGGAYLPSTSKCLDAQGNPIIGCQDLLAPLPGFGYTIGNDLSIGKYVNTVIKIVIGLMGIAAVFIIIGAGIEYMTSDSFGIKMGAKGKIQDAALGLAVIIGIYVILRTINPYLLDLNPDIKNIILDTQSVGLDAQGRPIRALNRSQWPDCPKKAIKMDSSKTRIVEGSTPKLATPIASSIRSGCGWRTLNGNEEAHPGIDFVAGMNTPVKAVADGTVKRAEMNSTGGFGNVIEIDHGNGTVSRYAHLESISVQNGASVVQGAVIGASGNSGKSIGPHLHLEVEQDNEKIDPEPHIVIK